MNRIKAIVPAAFLAIALTSLPTHAQSVKVDKQTSAWIRFTIDAPASLESTPFHQVFQVMVDVPGNYQVFAMSRAAVGPEDGFWMTAYDASMKDQYGNALGAWTKRRGMSIDTGPHRGDVTQYCINKPVSLVPGETYSVTIDGAATAYGKYQTAPVSVIVSLLD